MRRITSMAALAVLALAAGPAQAGHSWSNYHWSRADARIPLRVNLLLSGKWPAVVDKSIAEWRASSVFTLTSAVGSGSAKRCEPVGGQIVVCNAAYGQRGWLGIASVWTSNGHISQGTTKLNDSYYATGSRYDTPAWRAMVSCQEIGHDFGLGHVNETFTDPNTGSCMDYSNDPSGTAGTNGSKANIAPDAHDFAQLELIYGHGHATSSATPMATTNFGERVRGRPVEAGLPREPVGDTMADWGEPAHHDGKGRPDVFVKSLGNGHKVITHVFWAPDAKGHEADH